MWVRLLAGASLLVVVTLGPWWLALVAVGFHLLYIRGIEVIAIALLYDGFYGAHSLFPLMTVITLCGFLATTLLSSRFRMYNK